MIKSTITSPTKSWLDIDTNSDFSIYNFPFGVFKTTTSGPRIGSALGNYVIDLAVLHGFGYFDSLDIPPSVFVNKFLNDFIALGKPTTRAIRERLIELFNSENTELQNNEAHKANVLIPMAEVEMLMPVKVENYTDFYSSIEHATNVGSMFRDPKNALLPNWRNLPVGYHGRASSIIVSGTNFHRPKGQTKAADAELPEFGPTRMLDFELEMGFIVGKETQLGDSVSTKEADDYIFGMVLFNDWSARDIQSWEYVPLGPFLSKNFASSISPWVVTLEALEPFRVKGPVQEPKVLPYLQFEGEKNIDIHLEVLIQPDKQEEFTVCKSNYKYMYWNMNQQLAHHTVNGCNIKVGDIYASGTISGPTPESYGSMLELTWRGAKPIQMPGDGERKFIQDGDTVIMRGYAQKENVRVGFGEVKGKVLPSN